MRIPIKYETHFFFNEKLHDEYFELGDCIYGKEIVELLKRKRVSSFLLEYDQNTTLLDIINAVRCDLGVDNEKFLGMPFYYYFQNKCERYYINDYEQVFCKVAEKYLLDSDEQTITISVLLSCDAGAVATVHPLRFWMNSHEGDRHKKPHVHVTDNQHQYRASVCIDDGEIIAGNLPSKLAKIAKKKILSDQKFFYKCWNTMTDGLSVDINKHYGYIDY